MKNLLSALSPPGDLLAKSTFTKCLLYAQSSPGSQDNRADGILGYKHPAHLPPLIDDFTQNNSYPRWASSLLADHVLSHILLDFSLSVLILWSVISVAYSQHLPPPHWLSRKTSILVKPNQPPFAYT